MKIQYLGTAAAEGIPSAFCRCEICENARKKGGREIRTRSQALIDGKILIDICPDTYWHAITYNVNLPEIARCLVTHSHADHLYIPEIMNRKKHYSHIPEEYPPLHFYGSDGVAEALKVGEDGNITPDGRAVFTEVRPFEPFMIDGYRITALPAHHRTVSPMIFMIEHEGKTFLYGHDTGIFFDEVWDYFKNNKIRFDAVSLDCTEGVRHIEYEHHMNLERDFIVRDRMVELGLADENTVFIANHFSHNGLLSYTEALKPDVNKGFIITYDGMEIEI